MRAILKPMMATTTSSSAAAATSAAAAARLCAFAAPRDCRRSSSTAATCARAGCLLSLGSGSVEAGGQECRDGLYELLSGQAWRDRCE